MIKGILLAWVLSFFNFYAVAKTGMMELFQIEISMTTYYFIFAVLGLISSKNHITINKGD